MAYLGTAIPGCRERVFARIPAQASAALENALPTDWLSIEHSRYWVQGFVEEVGPERARETYAAFIAGWIVRSPLIKPLADAVIRISGLTPAAAIRVVPRALEVSYRDFFTARVLQIEKSSAVVLLESIAPEVAACPAYFVLLSGVLEGVIRFTGRSGLVTITPSDDLTSARCVFAWR